MVAMLLTSIFTQRLVTVHGRTASIKARGAFCPDGEHRSRPWGPVHSALSKRCNASVSRWSNWMWKMCRAGRRTCMASPNDCIYVGRRQRVLSPAGLHHGPSSRRRCAPARRTSASPQAQSSTAPDIKYISSRWTHWTKPSISPITQLNWLISRDFHHHAAAWAPHTFSTRYSCRSVTKPLLAKTLVRMATSCAGGAEINGRRRRHQRATYRTTSVSGDVNLTAIMAQEPRWASTPVHRFWQICRKRPAHGYQANPIVTLSAMPDRHGLEQQVTHDARARRRVCPWGRARPAAPRADNADLHTRTWPHGRWCSGHHRSAAVVAIRPAPASHSRVVIEPSGTPR